MWGIEWAEERARLLYCYFFFGNYLGELVAMVIVTLHPWCSGDLFPIARELIRLDWEGRSLDGVAGFLRAILCPLRVGNDKVKDCERFPGSPLDDSDLAALLELVACRSCSELLGTAFELLSERVSKSGVTLTAPPSENGAVIASTHLTKSLLGCRQSSLPMKVPVPFQCFGTYPASDGVDALPSQGWDTLAASLACLEPPKVSSSVLECPSPLLVSEDCALRLLKLSVDTATLPCAGLVMLLSGASPRIVECFETSHMHDVCLRAGEWHEGALEMVKDFSVRAGRKTVKTIRKLVLDKGVEILESGSQDEQVMLL